MARVGDPGRPTAAARLQGSAHELSGRPRQFTANLPSGPLVGGRDQATSPRRCNSSALMSDLRTAGCVRSSHDVGSGDHLKAVSAIVARAAICRNLSATTSHSIPRDVPRSSAIKISSLLVPTIHNVIKIRRVGSLDNLRCGTNAAAILQNPVRAPATIDAAPSESANQRTPRSTANARKTTTPRDSV